MNPSLTISTAPLEHPAMDYAFLRREGIRLLERLGSQLWTDFNAHDPGITILEQLCYALTDLSYRIDYDIKDLLAGEQDPYRSLYSPAKVLMTNPVTLNDLRKLVIDVPGVKNAWIEPVENSDPGLVYDPSEGNLHLKVFERQPPHRELVPLRGLYRILIETDRSLPLLSSSILPEVSRRLHACRSLAEDFTSPVVLSNVDQEIVVNASVEIGAVEDPAYLLAQIYHTLANFISPRIHFYTLTEMLDKGKDIDEILDGPMLTHGFIDNAELERFQRRAGLRTSDLLHEIMDVNGVMAVNNLSVSAGGKKAEDWYLKLDTEHAPFLDIDASLFASNGPTIRLTRGGIQVQFDRTQVEEIKKIIQSLQKAASHQPLPESERDIRLDAGRDRKIGQYHSIQHQFPAVYGIGAMGLPESASPERRAQAKQLKAYLMFFDQLLANYFAQLGNAKELFSFYTESPNTYFSQIIADASLGLDEIIINDPATHAANLQAMTENLSTIENISLSDELLSPAGRKNRFLNHLLARFAEQFTDYSLLQYAHLHEDDLIKDKCAFLQNYPAIGAARGTGFDYTIPAWGSDNISGLEKRISLMLGISSHIKQDLAGLPANSEGGFHLLEHILLRPRPDDTQTGAGATWQGPFLAQPESKDPYSHRISFVFPNWIERFKKTNSPGLISDWVIKTLRDETPAHIRIDVHALNPDQMLAFESAKKEWLEAMIVEQLWEPVHTNPNELTQLQLRDARDRMVQILGIGVPYPLRDVKLKYDSIVAYNHPASIQILGAQVGVRYILSDEDGTAIGESFEVSPVAGQADDQVFLNTPKIEKDITFTILAVREDHEMRLETYLKDTVSIKAGIDTKLPVAFQDDAGQLAQGARITINYGNKVTVIVSQSQEGISYKLVTGPKDNPVSLSKPKRGNKNEIVLVSSTDEFTGFTEDTAINVLAYRTFRDNISALLDTALAVMVRPDPSLAIDVEKLIVDYKTNTRLTLVASQASVEYRLYKRDLLPADYLPDGTAGSLIVPTDEGRTISVRAPEKITDWNNPSGFAPLDIFKNKNGSLSASTGNLLEDTLFIVQATKIENREQLQLSQAVVVLVRPNQAPTVSVAKAEVEAGAPGVVRVSGTQKGVSYQLRLDAGNKAINPPGYHQTDRGVDTTRLEVDFIVEDQGKPMLLLPAGTITQATSFNILAVKTQTGISAQLNDKATIGVAASAPDETSG